MEGLNFCYLVDENLEQIKMMGNSIHSANEVYGKYDCTINVISLASYGSEADKLIRETAKRNSVKIPCEVTNYDKRITMVIPLPTNSSCQPDLEYNAMSKFFIPYILKCDYLYYIDNDTIFVKDIYNKLTDFDYEKTLLRIWKGHTFTDFRPSDHVNSGFIYFNCRLWRKRKRVFFDLMKFYFDKQIAINYVDQTGFDWIASEKYKDMCIVENDLLINQRNVFDGVELLHCFGETKHFYWQQVEKLGYTK